MSGSSLPYHLRPHKSVDRRLFVDLLARFQRWQDLENHAYISMGAYPLEDHKQVHRLLGISNLITFDADQNIANRQEFNRFIGTLVCLPWTSEMIVDQLEEVLSSYTPDSTGLIIWLDYTSPKKIGDQIREFSRILDKLQPNDLVRVTVNAQASSWGSAQKDTGAQYPKEELWDLRYEALKTRIGEYLPSDAQSSDMQQNRLPYLLSRSFAHAAATALPSSGQNTFDPLSIVRYADGQQMLSITGVVADRSEQAAMRSRLNLGDWSFSSENWDDIHSLEVPDLTMREKLFLEKNLNNKTPEDIASELGFDFGNGVSTVDFIVNYKKYYRYYPSLLSAEI